MILFCEEGLRHTLLYCGEPVSFIEVIGCIVLASGLAVLTAAAPFWYFRERP